MNSFGENLKREREAKGISLQDVSVQTKIPLRVLHAIEEEQLGQLPGGAFVRSFLRQYARILDVDENFIVSEYVKAVGEEKEPQLAQLNTPLEPIHSSEFFLPVSSATGRIWRTVAVGACIGIVLAAGYGFRRVRAHRSSAAAAAAVSAHATASQQPSPTGLGTSNSSASPDTFAAGASNQSPGIGGVSEPGSSGTSGSRAPSADANPPASMDQRQPAAVPAAPAAEPAQLDRAAAGSSEAAASGLLLQIDARKDCWISVTADGQKQWQGNLKAAQSRRVAAKVSVQLTLGDAGAVTLNLNGKSLPPAGRAGEVKTLTISAKNLAASAP